MDVSDSPPPTRGPALTILGRQGSGKGTQAGRLSEHFGVVHVSTGDVLRAAVALDTPLGHRVAFDMTAGRLVADDVMCDVVRLRLEEPDVWRKGFVLDGYPRTPEQLEDLLAILGPRGLDAAIVLDVPLDEVRRRLRARRVCTKCRATTVAPNDEDEIPCPVCGGIAVRRPDDTPEAIERRLATYEAEAQPLLTALSELRVLIQVDATGTAEQVFERVVQAVRPIVWGTGEAVG